MQKMLPLIVALTFLWGCVYVPAMDDWTDGGIVVRAQFPRLIQIIPEGTQRIEVRVSGEGIPTGAVLVAALTPGETQATFRGVPAGTKVVVAKAFDAGGNPLAIGSSEVQIVAGATVTARVRLALTEETGRFHLVLE